MELREYIDFIIFIDTPYKLRLSRGIERDGIKSRETWIGNWMPREQEYFESVIHQPKEISNLVIDGTYEDRKREEYFN